MTFTESAKTIDFPVHVKNMSGDTSAEAVKFFLVQRQHTTSFGFGLYRWKKQNALVEIDGER